MLCGKPADKAFEKCRHKHWLSAHPFHEKGVGNTWQQFFEGGMRLDCCYVEQMKTEYGINIPKWKKQERTAILWWYIMEYPMYW